jgi:hypothetical protein
MDITHVELEALGQNLKSHAFAFQELSFTHIYIKLNYTPL